MRTIYKKPGMLVTYNREYDRLLGVAHVLAGSMRKYRASGYKGRAQYRSVARKILSNTVYGYAKV